MNAAAPPQRTHKLIGGFFALESDHAASNPDISLWDYWNQNTRSFYNFFNARSALYYLLSQNKARRIWMPSYICADILDALHDLGTELCFYSANPVSGYDIKTLKDQVQSADHVLYIRYFCADLPAEMQNFIQSRSDITWIEDACQAIDIDPHNAADWIINSPRKICGVGDGGLLISRKKDITAPSFKPSTDESHLTAAQMRRDDKAMINNARWYGAYKEIEAKMQASLRAPSDISHSILQRLDFTKIAERRKSNYSILQNALNQSPDYQILDSGHIAFCMVIHTLQAAALQNYLAGHNIFCARHWLGLASPQDQFPDDWALAQQLLSIPCDQRYNKSDMDFVAYHINAFFDQIQT